MDGRRSESRGSLSLCIHSVLAGDLDAFTSISVLASDSVLLAMISVLVGDSASLSSSTVLTGEMPSNEIVL